VKRLFALRNTQTGELGTEFFGSRQRARERRDQLNGGTAVELQAAEKSLGWVVTPGPDHDDFKG
jgi:hypothetical protein